MQKYSLLKTYSEHTQNILIFKTYSKHTNTKTNAEIQFTVLAWFELFLMKK